MDEFKVSVETLHTTKVKEINYEGEETYQEKPSLSKRLCELAQRIDFNEEDEDGRTAEDDTSNSLSKKAPRRWPWEYTHSKLKQALTEISVLSDVLHMLQNHRQYIATDHVYIPKGPTVPITLQYNIKKKALGVAASILRKGAEPLHHTSSLGDREFHKAIHDLRRRWRLRRTTIGVLGDLSYHSAGSLYTQSVQFDVHKGFEGSGDVSGSKDVLSVVVPQELRGKSEIVIFISDQPVREVSSLDAILPVCIKELHAKHSQLVPWEQILVSAQNVLFNEELFAQLAKEAFDQKSDLQGEVLTDRINIPLSTSTWLSVLLVREYDRIEKKNEVSSSPTQLPEPNWELSIAFKQLLRTNHQFVATARPPRPSNASNNESPQLRSAGSAAMSTSDMKQFEPDFSLYNKLLRMAKHLDNEKKLNQWLNDLYHSSTEPHLLLTSVPSLSLTSSLFYIVIATKGTSLRWSMELKLLGNSIQLKHRNKDELYILPVDKEKIVGTIRRQCMLYMKEVIEKLVESRKWYILFESTLPCPSLLTLKTGCVSSQTCGITIEEPNGRRRIELLIGYDNIVANTTDLSHTCIIADDNDTLESQSAPKDTTITLVATKDSNIINQLSQVLDI